MTVRLVFMGSPDFAAPSLQHLAQSYKIVGVVTQPDRPAGRGRTLTPPPIKVLAERLGLPVIQPARLREPEAMQQLLQWEPEVIVVAAFGQILRQTVLDLPKYGCINVHASLLPRWRGAAPIQAAILNGDTQTGVTIMRMDVGVDTGPVLSQRAEVILPEDTAGSLSQRLSKIGADLLLETLPAYLNGALVPEGQDTTLATAAPMLKKESGRLDFEQPAEVLARQVRAYQPWPGAYTIWQGVFLKILRASAILPDSSTSVPVASGQLARVDGLPAIGTVQGWLVLEEVQPAGKRSMSGEDFLRGAKDWGMML